MNYSQSVGLTLRCGALSQKTRPEDPNDFTRCKQPPHKRYVPKRRYYSVWPSARVDESLFGPAHRETEPDNRHDCYTYRTPNALADVEWRHGREWDKTQQKTVRITGNESIRYIKTSLADAVSVPRLDPPAQTLLLTPQRYNKLLKQSAFVTDEQLQAMKEQRERDRKQLFSESKERMAAMKKKDSTRVAKDVIGCLEEEELQKVAVMREIAKEKKLEAEDEMKNINSLIHNAKVHMVRDAQLKEKEAIKEELKTEEARLDKLMEEDRMNAILTAEAIEMKRHDQRLIAAKALITQIHENEQNRLLELEEKDQENVRMKKYLNSLCEDEIELIGRRDVDHAQYRRELDECLEKVQERKAVDDELEKRLMQDMIDFQDAKAKREAEYEAEQMRIKSEKEREIDRLRALQEKTLDTLAARNELRAKRDSEAADRLWRKKEAAAAMKVTDMKHANKEAFFHQLEEKEHKLTIQAQHDQITFARELKTIQETIEREEHAVNKAARLKRQFCADVLAQLKEREEARIDERRAWYQEGIDREEQTRRRCKDLEAIKCKKINELRNLGIPEKYLARIEEKGKLELRQPLVNAANR